LYWACTAAGSANNSSSSLATQAVLNRNHGVVFLTGNRFLRLRPMATKLGWIIDIQ